MKIHPDRLPGGPLPPAPAFRRLMLRWTGPLWVLLCCAVSLPAEATQVLRQRVTQRGDFIIFGNTLGHDCAANVPAPVVGTVGSCGNNTSDSAPDVYWRSDSPSAGSASASLEIPNADARSTAVLNLPAGAAISHAWLYWAATPPNGGELDAEVLLERPGVFSAPLKADSVLTFVAREQVVVYRGSKDVTSLLQSYGPGDYRLGGVSSVGLSNVSDSNPVAVWWMVVLYELASEPLRDLAVFDGLDGVSSTTSSTISLSGFLVPTTGYEGKLGVVSLEGDGATSGDALTWDGRQLTDAMNPATNFFNGTRSYLGAAVSTPGDLPQLSGMPSSMSGLDMDVLDVTSLLKAGQNSATMTASSSGDVFFVTAFVTSIATFIPDLSSSLKSVQDLNGGYVVGGDLLEYQIRVRNTGTDAATGVVLEDPLPSGVSFETGSLTVSSDAASSELTDAFDEDQGEYDSTHHTLMVRLGSGADALQGGTLEAGAEITVRFRVRVKNDARGTLANQALLTYAGLKGSPTRTVPTDADPSEAGASVTLLQMTPDSDGDGLLDPLENAVGLNPNDRDSDDDGVTDGTEPDFSADTDGDGLINALDPDADDDGLADGTELGLDCSLKETNPAAQHCVADHDPSQQTDPLHPDSDADGLPDGTEDLNVNGAVDSGETNPLKADSDGDGYGDLLDLCPVIADPTQADADLDGLGDACDHDQDGDGFEDEADVCPLIPQTENADADQDGEGDACDADDDNDGLEDPVDNCPTTPNFDQLDTDRDGQGDPCDADDDQDGLQDQEDLCPLDPVTELADLDLDGLGNTCDEDDDQDGVADELDNCPLLYNPTQSDRNLDGTGDACALDFDADGVDDGLDNCPSTSNAEQDDLDSDGKGDLCDSDVDGDLALNEVDNCPQTPNGEQQDSDRDGMGDACDEAPLAEDWTLEGSGWSCSTQPESKPSGAWSSLLALVLLLSWQRRPQKPQKLEGSSTAGQAKQAGAQEAPKCPRNTQGWRAMLLILAPLLVGANDAQGQGLNIRRFAGNAGDTQGFTHLENAFVAQAGLVQLGASSYFADAPLVASREGTQVTLIEHELGLDVNASIGLGHHLQLGLVMPFALREEGQNTENHLPLTPLSGTATGDLRVGLKAQLLELKPNGTQHLALGLALPLSFPTGEELAYFGEEHVTAEPRLLLSYAGTQMRAGAQAGVLLRSSQSALGLTTGHELRLAGGMSWQALRRLSLQLETMAAIPITQENAAANTRTASMAAQSGSQSGSQRGSQLALEGLLSARLQLRTGQQVTLGAGPGLSRGYGVPAWRVVLGYAYTPPQKLRVLSSREESTPDAELLQRVEATALREKASHEKKVELKGTGEKSTPEKSSPLTASAGTTGTGSSSAAREAGSKVASTPDVDGDGVADADDGCPYEAEDRDRYLDRDGCPEPDNDADGVLDADDRCPQEAEDKDGLGDEDGCPESDLDQDGHLDEQDQCPRKAESINGLRDEDGCPDEGRGKVRRAQGQLELDEPVFYEVGKAQLLARSLPLLQQVAWTLKALPADLTVEVQVHLDAVAAEKFGEALSQSRAEQVMYYLIQQGVKAERLRAKGYGASQPVAPNDSESQRAQNRRTLFVLNTTSTR